MSPRSNTSTRWRLATEERSARLLTRAGAVVHHAEIVTLKGKSYRLRERTCAVVPAAPIDRCIFSFRDIDC
jgi:hypothetical protein